MRERPQLYPFACDCTVVSVPFVKKTILSPLTSLGTFVKSKFLIDTWIDFWALNSTPLTYTSSQRHTIFISVALQ